MKQDLRVGFLPLTNVGENQQIVQCECLLYSRKCQLNLISVTFWYFRKKIKNYVFGAISKGLYLHRDVKMRFFYMKYSPYFSTRNHPPFFRTYLHRVQPQQLLLSFYFQTYECLCDIYITYTNELEELTKSFKQMAKLKLVIEDVQLQNVLITFLEKHVISSTTSNH